MKHRRDYFFLTLLLYQKCYYIRSSPRNKLISFNNYLNDVHFPNQEASLVFQILDYMPPNSSDKWPLLLTLCRVCFRMTSGVIWPIPIALCLLSIIMSQVFCKRLSHVPSKICFLKFYEINGKYPMLQMRTQNLTFAIICSNENVTDGMLGSWT